MWGEKDFPIIILNSGTIKKNLTTNLRKSFHSSKIHKVKAQTYLQHNDNWQSDFHKIQRALSNSSLNLIEKQAVSTQKEIQLANEYNYSIQIIKELQIEKQVHYF